MASLDFFDGMYFVHPTMPGQAMLAAVLGDACAFTGADSHDVSEMFLVSIYTFVGWHVGSRLLRLVVAPRAKGKFTIDLVNEEPEEVTYEEESLLECDRISYDIPSKEHQSSALVPLEHYGNFCAESASRTLPCVQRAEPKCGVAKRDLGMSILEQYGVFDAAPGAWCAPCTVDLDDHQQVIDDALDDAIEDALEKAVESAIEQVKDEEERLLDCDQILSDIVAEKQQSSLDDWENVLNDMLDDGLDDALEKLLVNSLEQASDIVPAKYLSSDLVPVEHYGAFGAGPGSWAMPRVERQEPKCDNLGMALLEHYGVFDAVPGAWDYSQCES